MPAASCCALPVAEEEEQQGSGEGGSESADDSQLDDAELDLMGDEFLNGEQQSSSGAEDSEEGADGVGGLGDDSDQPESGAEDAETEQARGKMQPGKGQGAKFTEGGKGASFSKAFAKIMQRPVRGLAPVAPAGQALQAAAATGLVAVRGVVGEAAILSVSASAA